MLKHDWVNVNHQTNDGDTALIWASKCGYKEIAVELLKCDVVDVNLQDINGTTALLAASREGHADIVVELLKHGKVQVNCQANFGHTALSLASIHGHTDIVWELLQHNPCDALVWAIATRHTETATCLEEHVPSNTHASRRQSTATIRF